MTRTLYLNKYYDIQDRILVCYRPTLTSWWNDRCLFLSEDYDPLKPYNHRSILDNEIVIEFDEEDTRINRKDACVVSNRLTKDKINWSKWDSGNKSTHVHFFVDIKDAKNLPLLKKVVMRHYSKGLSEPDIRLASEGHLIRMEYGIHEKTCRTKIPVSKSKNYPNIDSLPNEVWQKYLVAQERSIKQRMSLKVNKLSELPGFKYVVDSTKFRASDDGRERALFMLIHVLKTDYENNQDGLVKFLQEWYRYSGGRKLTDYDIERKVKYHWKKTYHFGVTYLNDLLVSIGKPDLAKGL